MVGLIVTIDGPAGAGKSTAARLLAERLGFTFLDTGAMYRAIALAALQAGLAPDDHASLAALANQVRLDLCGDRVYLDGADVTRDLRTSAVTQMARRVADSPGVRHKLVELQRAFAQGKNIVTEGRDQGTIVFPQADCKFFLTADPTIRARRRWAELQLRGEEVSFEQVLQALHERDAADRVRSLAPLRPAADAIVVDTSHLSIMDVVDRLERLARERLKLSARSS